MGLMNFPAMRAHGCGQWVRSYGVNELYFTHFYLSVSMTSAIT